MDAIRAWSGHPRPGARPDDHGYPADAIGHGAPAGAAFNADGLPRLAARFFSSYTETSATVAIPADELSQNLLLTDLRLLTTVGRAAGFAIGQDMNWVIDCATVLAADALADRPPPAAPIQVDGSSAPEIAHDLLHLMGQDILSAGNTIRRCSGPPACRRPPAAPR